MIGSGRNGHSACVRQGYVIFNFRPCRVDRHVDSRRNPYANSGLITCHLHNGVSLGGGFGIVLRFKGNRAISSIYIGGGVVTIAVACDISAGGINRDV